MPVNAHLTNVQVYLRAHSHAITDAIHLQWQALFSFLFTFARLSLEQVTKNEVCLKSGILNR